jgi:dihydrofolate reductase
MVLLLAKDGKNIFVVGGANTIHPLLENNWIDELQISIISILLGNAIAAFSNRNENSTHLKLIHSQTNNLGL